jgi:hypothetical protein
MDAFVQLALIEKAKRVFAIDQDVMLSFPLLTPLGFTPAELAALAAPATADDYAAAADFARAVNFLPRDMVANTSERMLWDVYQDVLDRADVAKGDAEEAEGDSTTILYTMQPDGSRTESDALLRYRLYRDRWFVAREDYAAQKLTGELSEDPAVRQSWADHEPGLRVAIDAAMTLWESLGRRVEIESAINAEMMAALKAPGARWAEWRAAFNPDIDLITDASGGGQYAPTGLTPRDFAEDDWLSFELSAGEMKILVDEAPADLKKVLDDDGSGDIESVSFEYRSVGLVRPWFRPEAMASRIWRSDDPALMLSDGAVPPTGVCPAYVTACIFVRKITVVQRGAGSSFRDLRFTIDPKRLNLRREAKVDPRLFARFQISRDRVGHLMPPPPPPARLEQAPRVFAALRRNSIRVLQRTPSLHAEAVGVRLPREVFGTPPPPPPPPAPAPESDELSILAFICRRLPKAPDPAPDLRWS